MIKEDVEIKQLFVLQLT